MKPNSPAPHVRKKNVYLVSETLFRSLTPPGLAQKKPSQFASALAHEVRNPLSNIKLAVEMLNSIMNTEDQKIYLDIITRGALRINDIITDVLISFQAGEAQLEKHSVHELLDEVIALTKDRIMLKNIIIKKEYTTRDNKVLVNKEKIKIALANIIINAIDSMPAENGQLILSTCSINGKCVVEIEDNGCGISRENLKSIFKPYFTNKPGGLGLGLSTTLDILLSNNTGIDVQSEEGRGTRFILSFYKTRQPGKYEAKKILPEMISPLQ